MLKKHWKSGILIEWVLAGLIILSVVRTIWYLFAFKHLPAPFFYEPGDVFGDWFNTAFWARNAQGAFDTWTTLYPPLSFVLLRLIGFDQCYPRVRDLDPSPGYAARDCDWLGHVAIGGFWVLALVLVFLSLRKIDRARAIPRTICVVFGWPMLNAIERGNLVLIAFPLFVLAVMPILKSARLRWVCAALAINLKVYLVAPFLAQLFLRRWRWVEGTLIATVVIYLASYGILGAGTLHQIITNLSAWSQNTITNPLDFWPATTYQGLSSLLESKDKIFPALLVLGSRQVEIIPLLIEILLRATQLSLLIAMASVWLRPEVVTRYRVYLLAILFALVTTEGGGYTPIFWFVLVMTERWSGFGAKFAIVACYLMANSYDIPIANIATMERYSYIFDTQVIVDMELTLWPLIRPLFIQLIALAISAATLRTVWSDVHNQGWAQRWRFRHDAPLLPWIRRPEQPYRNNLAD